MNTCEMSSESDFSGDSAYEYNSDEENETYTVKEAYEHVLEFLSHKEESMGNEETLKIILQADKDLYDTLEISSKLAELRPKIRMLVYQINTLNATMDNLRDMNIKDALPLLKSYGEEQQLLQKFLKESHHYTYEEVIESKQLLAKNEIMNRLEQRLTSLRDQRQEASTMLSVLERFENNKDIFFSTYTKQQERAALRAKAAERRKQRRAKQVSSYLTHETRNKRKRDELEARPETAKARSESAKARSESAEARAKAAEARAKAAEARAKKRALEVVGYLTPQKKTHRTRDPRSEERAKQLEEMLKRKK